MEDRREHELKRWFLEKNFVSVHAFILYATLYLTYESFIWAGQFAMKLPEGALTSGIGPAAIIAAVTGPVTALQVFAFKTYSESRKSEQ
jgi:hypothetical protein